MGRRGQRGIHSRQVSRLLPNSAGIESRSASVSVRAVAKSRRLRSSARSGEPGSVAHQELHDSGGFGARCRAVGLSRPACHHFRVAGRRPPFQRGRIADAVRCERAGEGARSSSGPQITVGTWNPERGRVSIPAYGSLSNRAKRTTCRGASRCLRQLRRVIRRPRVEQPVRPEPAFGVEEVQVPMPGRASHASAIRRRCRQRARAFPYAYGWPRQWCAQRRGRFRE